MKHRRASILLIIVFALSLHLPSAGAQSVATVVTMNGPADIEKAGGSVVAVTTGADTTVIVQIDGTHEVTVYQNTQLRIGDVLRLRVGTVRIRGSSTVATASAMSTVRESEMTVAYDDSAGITTVEVADGEAAVQGSHDDGPRRVPAGQMVRAGNDGRTTTPRTTAVEILDPTPLSAARLASVDEDTAGERALPSLVVITATACLLVGVSGLIVTRRARKPRAAV